MYVHIFFFENSHPVKAHLIYTDDALLESGFHSVSYDAMVCIV